jgi:hypothetical protein
MSDYLKSYSVHAERHEVFVLLVEAAEYGPEAEQIAADRACRLIFSSFFGGDTSEEELDAPDPPPVYTQPVEDEPCTYQAYRADHQLKIGKPFIVMPIDCFRVRSEDRRMSLVFRD